MQSVVTVYVITTNVIGYANVSKFFISYTAIPLHIISGKSIPFQPRAAVICVVSLDSSGSSWMSISTEIGIWSTSVIS